MSRSNYDKPFYVDVGTSVVAIRCASNNDVVIRYPLVIHPHTENLAKDVCDRMNREAAICKQPLRNCDVGTADEQHARFVRFCDKYEDCWECPVWCGVDLTSKCSVYWSQMPYEEGGEK